MIGMLTGLFARGHKLTPLERDANRRAVLTKRDIGWWRLIRGAGWVVVTILLAFALVGAVVLLVCPVC